MKETIAWILLFCAAAWTVTVIVIGFLDAVTLVIG